MKLTEATTRIAELENELNAAQERIVELESEIKAIRAANSNTMNPAYHELLAHLVEGPKSIGELAGLLTRENRTVSQWLHALKVRHGVEVPSHKGAVDRANVINIHAVLHRDDCRKAYRRGTPRLGRSWAESEQRVVVALDVFDDRLQQLWSDARAVVNADSGDQPGRLHQLSIFSTQRIGCRTFDANVHGLECIVGKTLRDQHRERAITQFRDSCQPVLPIQQHTRGRECNALMGLHILPA